MRYTDPLLPIIVIVAVIGLIRAWRRGAERPWLLSISILGLLIISSPLLAAIFSKPLESRYEPRSFVDTGKAIVVLGGACETPSVDRPLQPLAADSYTRSFYAAKLYNSAPPRPVLVTGSKCGASLAHALESQGVPKTDILEEDRANNTHENAVYSSQILRSKGIDRVTLVTDAKSMLRAELCFRKESVTVVPYLVGPGFIRRDVSEFIPSWQAIRSNSDTFHEMAGLLWYWGRGWI